MAGTDPSIEYSEMNRYIKYRYVMFMNKINLVLTFNNYDAAREIQNLYIKIKTTHIDFNF